MFYRLLSRAVEGLIFLGATTIVTIVTTEVVLRYVFMHSLIFTEELSRYLMVWIVFLGSVLAVRDGAHIHINFLTKRFDQRFAHIGLSLTVLSPHSQHIHPVRASGRCRRAGGRRPDCHSCLVAGVHVQHLTLDYAHSVRVRSTHEPRRNRPAHRDDGGGSLKVEVVPVITIIDGAVVACRKHDHFPLWR